MNWGELLSRLDLTEIFRDKGRGDLRRWSARRTIGGAVVITACHEITETGCTWQLVTLAAIGMLPLIVSTWGRP